MNLDRRKLSIITLTHIITDSYTAFIPLAVPFLIEKYNFSVALAGSLGVILSLSTNLPQPFFGHIYDKAKGYLIYLSPLLSALFVGTAVLMPSYGLMVLFLIIGGIGVAMFHPEATHIAKNLDKNKGSLAISIFLAGGTGGYAIGGFIAAILIKFFGLPGLAFSVLFGIIASYVLFVNKKFLMEQKEATHHSLSANDLKEINSVPQFILIFCIVTIIVSLS
ncbi:MAG: MFS transporter, partial [Candidatus Firestonebacteria bacterium]